ncbi:retrotransposon protein, putative, ty1-copia subclass [Tanacetum coccineum]
MGYSFYYPPENKVIVARNNEFFDNSLITQEASGSLEDLEVIQDKEPHSSENTSLHHDEDEQEIVEPQSNVNLVRRFTRTRHAPGRMCLYVDTEEHELGDHNEPTNYKVALSNPESEKWLDATNVEMILISIVAFSGEVYMVQPKDIVNPKHPNLDLSKHLGNGINDLIRRSRNDMIMGNHIPMLQYVKSYLGKCFSMKNLGEAAYILGIKIYKDRSRWLIELCQSAHIEKILKRFNMENSKHGLIPMQENPKLSKAQGASTPDEVKRMQRVPYASVVGFIMYVVRCTRPDVAFAQNITRRFQQNPSEFHSTIVNNIMKYLRNTKDMFLVYGRDIKWELRVTYYTDARYLIDVDDSKS